MAEILQILIYGVVLGAIIALGAIGVSLLFGILRFAHFAHGDLMTLGAYLALAALGLGLPLWVGIFVAMAGTAAAALAIDRALYRPLRRRTPIVLLISSFGVALMLRSLILIIWGPTNLVYESGIQIPYRIGDLRIKPDQIAILIAAIAIVAALHLFLQRTKMGKAMRATADNMDLARTSGIDVEHVIRWTWIIGGALAAAAGALYAMDTRLNTVLGWGLLLPIFAAAILGGIGRPYGAIAGGLVIGIVEELSTLILSPAYKSASAFAIMVALLILRPTGLFRGR